MAILEYHSMGTKIMGNHSKFISHYYWKHQETTLFIFYCCQYMELWTIVEPCYDWCSHLLLSIKVPTVVIIFCFRFSNLSPRSTLNVTYLVQNELVWPHLYNSPKLRYVIGKWTFTDCHSLVCWIKTQGLFRVRWRFGFKTVAISGSVRLQLITRPQTSGLSQGSLSFFRATWPIYTLRLRRPLPLPLLQVWASRVLKFMWLL